LVDGFEEGINTKIIFGKDNISLGQKQIIAFIRAILRKPEILILDEATANIDTVTEKLLEDIIDKLPKSTTKVIIAHRLNTIENADQIFFVNSGITLAGSMQDAVDMLMNKKRNS
ncbi:MAG: ATP-binding cassette domain-containing protein, partial [Patescibacteria group bacterium]